MVTFMPTTKLSQPARHALLSAVYEYLLITTPIAIYIGLEVAHTGHWVTAFQSPEWAIAIIFLTFQGIASYAKDIIKTGKVSVPLLGVVAIVALLVVVFASVNAYLSLINNSLALIWSRAVLLIFVSIIFLLMVGGARLLLLNAGDGGDGT
jgi:hypothetical protein